MLKKVDLMDADFANDISLATLRVLLVDDDSFMLELIGDMLRDMGVTRIVTATDGRRAAEMMNKSQPLPDVVISDLNMPNRDGFQLMEELAANKYPGSIVLLSGLQGRVLNSAGLMARFHHLKVVGTLQKPVSRDALAQALIKAL